MANYMNQLTFYLNLDKVVRHTSDKSSDNFAPWVYWKYKKAAMKKLTGNGYKLWEYMFSWAGNGKFDLSPKALMNEIGISDKGIRNARKELEEYGCIKLREGKNNVYDFFPDAIL